MYTKFRPRSTSNNMFLCLGKEQRRKNFAAMQMYSIATKPMVYKDETKTKKSFFADDGAVPGTLETIHERWISLLAQGPKFGYFPNASILILLVKSEYYEWALQIFEGCGVNVTTDAIMYLGGYDGPRETCDQPPRGKVSTLITHLEKLSELAEAEPHAAFSFFVSHLNLCTKRYSSIRTNMETTCRDQ